MQYATEELRDQFHKQQTMLQVICAMLENYFFGFGQQLMFTDLEVKTNPDPDSTYAYLICPTMDDHPDMLMEAAKLINERFKRKDGSQTCILPNPDVALFLIYVTHPSDLAQLL